MAAKSETFEDELDALSKEGGRLEMAMLVECQPTQFRQAYLGAFDQDEDRLDAFIKDLPDFESSYQKWYSKAQAVVKQVMPDRLSDFSSYYEYPRARKEIDYQNYMIRDYLQGLRVTRRGGAEVVVDKSAAIPEFRQQLSIVVAAKEALSSKLMDLTAILQADLFDSEVESAAALAQAGFNRAAGAICGVVIEKHLQFVCDTHGITSRKKTPGISDLSQILRDADVTTVPQWRFIQHLADIRNVCDHAKGREPTKDEIDDLVVGTRKVLKTVF